MLNSDQADRLRRLVRQCAASNDPADNRSAPAPNEPATSRPAPARKGLPVVLLSGGKGGVGTTTLAANLAAVLAGRGLRVALIDADLRGSDIEAICSVEPRWTIGDVLAGRKQLADALTPGPQGIRILSGLWGLEKQRGLLPADGDRLLGQLADLGGMVDTVVVDAGNGLNPWLRGWWSQAAAVLLVATPDRAAVLGAYAALKVHIEERLLHDCSLVVNFAPTFQAARDVQLRITQTAARFLAFRPRWLGYVPAEHAVAEATRAGRLFVEAAPGCVAAGCLRRMGAELASAMAAAVRAGPAGQQAAVANLGGSFRVSHRAHKQAGVP